MDHIERTLKDLSDQFLKVETEKEENAHFLKTGKIKSVEDLRDICGVMKVGALSAQMNLKGEKEFLAVLMTREKPTFTLLEQIAVAVEKYFATNYHENYKGKYIRFLLFPSIVELYRSSRDFFNIDMALVLVWPRGYLLKSYIAKSFVENLVLLSCETINTFFAP